MRSLPSSLTATTLRRNLTQPRIPLYLTQRHVRNCAPSDISIRTLYQQVRNGMWSMCRPYLEYLSISVAGLKARQDRSLAQAIAGGCATPQSLSSISASNALAPSARVYRPRHPERTVLYRALAHRFERFLLVYEE